MPFKLFRQLVKGLILSLGLALLNACVQEPKPLVVVPDSEQPVAETNVIAQSLTPQPQEEIAYEPEFPEIYIVQEGDTLWDISTVFLRDPWLWPEIWFKNPQVENPHLIYPGDTLAIIYVGGKRRVQLITRGEDGNIITSTSGDIADSGLKVVKINILTIPRHSPN